MLHTEFIMADMFQIGGILIVAVGVLGSALLIAWRDASRDHRAAIAKD
jgi:hypothetical protein